MNTFIQNLLKNHKNITSSTQDEPISSNNFLRLEDLVNSQDSIDLEKLTSPKKVANQDISNTYEENTSSSFLNNSKR